MVAQADPVPLGVVEVDGPPGPVHHEDARGLEAVLPRAPLARGDPERDEVDARLPVAPRVRRRRRLLLRALEGEELAVAEREPHAPIPALLAGPPAQDGEAEHLPVEPLAAVEIRALEGHVVE